MAKFREIMENIDYKVNVNEAKKVYIKIPSMSSDEIGKELGITRQFVHKSLKKGLGKIWKTIGEMHPDESPYAKFYILVQMMKLDEKDAKSMLRAFSPDIRKEIEDDARTRM